MTDLSTYRNRHDREEHHFGEFFASLVGITSDLDAQITAGMTLEQAIGIIHDRLTILESRGAVRRSFTADAYIEAGTTFVVTADAVIEATLGGSMTADAIVRIERSSSVTADSTLERDQPGAFAADAITQRDQASAFTADAEITSSATTFTFTADAVVEAIIAADLTADAVISDGSEGFSSTLGEFTLGDSSLGG